MVHVGGATAVARDQPPPRTWQRRGGADPAKHRSDLSLVRLGLGKRPGRDDQHGKRLQACRNAARERLFGLEPGRGWGGGGGGCRAPCSWKGPFSSGGTSAPSMNGRPPSSESASVHSERAKPLKPFSSAPHSIGVPPRSTRAFGSSVGVPSGSRNTGAGARSPCRNARAQSGTCTATRNVVEGRNAARTAAAMALTLEKAITAVLKSLITVPLSPSL